jgi:hypothetical protein
LWVVIAIQRCIPFFSSWLSKLLVCFTRRSFVDIFAGRAHLRAAVIALGQVVLWTQTLFISPLRLFSAHQFSRPSADPGL